MRQVSTFASALALVTIFAGNTYAQDFAAKLNAPRVNLVSNVTNWQNTLQFDRLMQTSTHFRSLISSNARFTVFAVENDTLASNGLPIDEVDRIVGRREKPLADRIVGAHILRGIVTSSVISAQITRGEGTATFMTISGIMLTATREDGKIVLTSPNGQRVQITSANHLSRNGIVHVVDGVLDYPTR